MGGDVAKQGSKASVAESLSEMREMQHFMYFIFNQLGEMLRCCTLENQKGVKQEHTEGTEINRGRETVINAREQGDSFEFIGELAGCRLIAGRCCAQDGRSPGFLGLATVAVAPWYGCCTSKSPKCNTGRA